MSGVPNRVLIFDGQPRTNKISACCESMKFQLKNVCQFDKHKERCPDNIIIEIDGMPFLFAQNATYNCYYCPWCGQRVSYKKYAIHTETNEEIDFDEENLDKSLTNGVYRHFKGGIYVIIGSDKDYVYYKSVNIDAKEIWARPYNMFFEEVDIGGEWKCKMIKRFEKIS
jgi:hypothetical protein